LNKKDLCYIPKQKSDRDLPHEQQLEAVHCTAEYVTYLTLVCCCMAIFHRSSSDLYWLWRWS